MNIAIAGSGAMGCRFGWRLYQSGHDVLLIDSWKDHVKAIQANGLEVKTENGSSISKIPASFPSDSKGTAELLIVFTKAMQTQSMVESCLHLIGDKTWVLTLQNGLGNIEIIERYVPKHRILAGVTTFATELLAPGKIQALGSGDTEIMRVEGEISEEVEEIARMMDAAGLRTVISPSALISIWNKVAFNCVLNPLCTLMNNTVGAVGSYSGIMDLAGRIIDEIILVAKAENIQLHRETIIAMIEKQFDPKMASHHLASMLQDMQSGRKTEIEYLNGAIVKKGEQYGIPVPNNEFIYHLILMMEETRKHRLGHH
jgi:2-dehydropantoate 2-reductase